MRHWSIMLAAAALLPPFAQAAPAKPDLAIAAVVGQEAISSYDADSRMALVLTTTNLSNTADVAAKLRPQILRALIDEKLQIAEAAKNDISISDQEVAQAVAAIERSRGMKPGDILEKMRSRNIPKETFYQQLRAQLAWRKLVMKKVRPLVRIGDEEVKLAQMSPAAAGPAQELEIAILVLPVDNPKRDAEVRHLSEKLSSELRGGADFEEVSRQVSGSKAEKFWVRPEQLDPSVARVLASAQAGAITPPVRTGNGYTIAKVYDVRAPEEAEAKDQEVLLKEILLRLKPGAPQEEADALLSIGESVARHPGGCDEPGIAGIEGLKDIDIEVNQRRELLSALPAGIRSVADGLKVGEISTPLASDSGIRLYMLCERKEAASSAAVAERVRNQLYVQKLELEAQKYLMSLRRGTYIEIR